MQSFYVSSNGFVGEINHSPEEAVIVHKYRLDSERRLFIKICEFSWDVKVKVEIHAATTVEESLTGQNIHVILVSQQSQAISSLSMTFYLVCVDLVTDKFVPLRKFNVNPNFSKSVSIISSCSKTLCKYLTILDGPCVAVFLKSEVAFYYCDQSPVLKKVVFNFNNFDFTTEFHECCKDIKSTVKFKELLGTIKFENSYLLFILFQNCAKCPTHGSKNKNVAKVLQFSENKFMVLNANQFIPDEYNENLTCINIRYIKHNGLDTFDSELYLGTSESFIVYVKNGSFIDCNNISDNEPIISLKMRSDLNGEKTGILALTDKIVYELTSKLQIKRQYEGIIHVVVGDNFNDGSFQYLLVKHPLSEGSSWVLTNLNKVIISSDDHDGRGDGEQKQTSGSSSTAIKALKARLQKEQILLHEEELQARRREDFLADMFKKQVSIASGVTSNPDNHQPCMVNLVAGIEDKPWSKPESRASIEVKGHWQRTYEDYWCVGVDVECHSERSTKAWLEVVLDDSQTKILKTKSSCLTLRAKQTGSHYSTSQSMSNGCNGIQQELTISVKRQKIVQESSKFGDTFDKNEGVRSFCVTDYRETSEKESGTSVCVLSVPMLGCWNSVKANLILNWTYSNRFQVGSQKVSIQKEDVGEDIVEDSDNHGRVYTKCCGHVTLTCDDIISGRYELNFDTGLDDDDNQEMADFREMRNNQLAWQHIQTVHNLVVKGTPGTLARLESLLTHTCGFVYNQHYDCYVTKVKALASVQVQLEPQTTDDGILIKVYTRNDKDLCLTIHHLYGNLPDNIVILPKENSSSDIIRKCVPVLQKEADFLSHGLRKLLSDHEAEKASSDTDDENDEGDIRKVGEKFKRRREKMLRKQNDVINDEKLKQFIEQYKKVKDMTDLVIATRGNVQCNS